MQYVHVSIVISMHGRSNKSGSNSTYSSHQNVHTKIKRQHSPVFVVVLSSNNQEE